MPGSEVETWPKIRNRLIREKGCCILCGLPGERVNRLIVHHKIPVIDGGRSREENLAVLHSFCHAALEPTGLIQFYLPAP